MKNKLFLLLILLLTIPGISAAAELRTLEIDFAFTLPDDPAKDLTGYTIYQNGEPACEAETTSTTTLSCELLTEDGTFDFALAATYTDNTESPQSPIFPYTIGTVAITPTPPPVSDGSRIITYSWDQNLTSIDIAGYRMYMNDDLLCETADPTATTLSCTTDLINAPMAFSVASYDTSGIESLRSNFLLLDPADFPELFLKNSLTFNWDYTDDASNAGGFRIYLNANLLCQTTDSSARQLSCEAEPSTANQTFALTAVDASGIETALSNAITYTPETIPEPLPETVPLPPAYTTGSTSYTAADTADSRTITYSWDASTSDSTTAGYRMYMNDSLLCETNDPGATSLSCTTALVNEDMTFSIASFDINGMEGTHYTILQLAPTDFPDIFPYKSITFNWEYTDGATNEGGFAIYYNDKLLCKTDDSSARELTCETDFSATTHTFAIKALDALAIETDLSNTIVYSTSIIPTDTVIEPPPVTESEPAPTPEPLMAVLTPTPSSGEVPLSISLTSTGSTGDIATWSWEFGDGTSATGSNTNHIYSIPGTYSATLRIEDADGTFSLASATITALPSAPPEPPTAILSSSTAAGNAPLAVIFDGAASTTPNAPIAEYSWTFGDGSQATGETASHTYSTAGTYHTELTVTDSLGLTDTVDTPIIVLGTAIPNEKPTAVITADQAEGSAPLLVSFDGTQSSDPDGSISRYDWNFGDGTTATGPTAQHTYIEPAVYTMTLQVTDNLGETATVSRQITCSTAPPENILNFEVGEITIDHVWVKVLFENSYTQPIVIAGPPTFNGSNQLTVRIRNIDQEGFEIRLQEWDYLDGSHTEETLSYMVMEKGTHTLDSGIKIEAGSFKASARFQGVTLQQPYDLIPVILTQVITEIDPNAVTGRTQKSSQTSFEYKLQEQETTKNGHAEETVGYIAWEPGKGEFSGLQFEAGITAKSITHNWFNLTFLPAFPDPPLFMADMQTYAGSDTAVIRMQNLTQATAEIKIEEEQSKDSETDHAAEALGHLSIGNATAAPN